MTVDLKAVRVGNRVKAERESPARGSWKRYAGKSGTVIAVSKRAKEIGVDFDGGNGITVWFRPEELVAPKSRVPLNGAAK